MKKKCKTCAYRRKRKFFSWFFLAGALCTHAKSTEQRTEQDALPGDCYQSTAMRLCSDMFWDATLCNKGDLWAPIRAQDMLVFADKKQEDKPNRSGGLA